MMRRSLSVGMISLCVGVAGACAKQAVPPAAVAAVPDGCVVALAEGQGRAGLRHKSSMPVRMPGADRMRKRHSNGSAICTSPKRE